jgi:hypothetical protein
MNRVLFTICLLLISPFTLAENPSLTEMGNIHLTEAKEIEKAELINTAFGHMSDQVTECIKKQNGKIEGCTCGARITCPFHKEFNKFIGEYCDAVKTYPEWKKYNVWYEVGDDHTIGHTLGTKNINIHYGKECN